MIRINGRILLAACVLVSPAANAKEKPVQQLPIEIQGTWADDLHECTQPESEGQLKIGPKIMGSVALKLTIKRIRHLGDGALEASGRLIEGEQRPITTSVEIKLLSKNQLKVMEQTFFRCTHSFA